MIPLCVSTHDDPSERQPRKWKINSLLVYRSGSWRMSYEVPLGGRAAGLSSCSHLQLLLLILHYPLTLSAPLDSGIVRYKTPLGIKQAHPKSFRLRAPPVRAFY